MLKLNRPNRSRAQRCSSGYIGAFFALVALTSSVSADSAYAQDAGSYPTKPIYVIAPFPGFYENVARVLAESISDQTKQTAITEVKPGGDGMIASQYVVRQPADGYTLYVSGSGPHAANAAMYKNLGYDPVKDFEPVSGVMISGLLIAVPPTSPVNSIADLTAMAKKDPEKLVFAGTGASGQAAVELYKSLANVHIRHVPYKSPPQGLIDLMTGRVDLMAVTLADGVPLMKEKKIKVLAITSSARSPLTPDVPTMQEAGIKDYEITFWFAVYVRSGTPKPIIAKLNQMIGNALNSSRVKTYLESAGVRSFYTSPEQLAAFQASETVKWRNIVETAGMQRQQ